MTLFDLLDRPIAFHAPLVDLTGSATAAILLSQAIYWSRRTKHEGGWFYKSQEEWRDETRLSRSEQESARKKLRSTGFWEEKYDRLNHRMWYRVNQDALIAAIVKAKAPECRNPAFGKAEVPHSFNKAENTSKNTKGAFEKARKGSFPIFPYPETEDDMIQTLEREGVEYNPDYDGNFFDTMTACGWTIRSKPVHDWVSTYQARLEKTTDFKNR